MRYKVIREMAIGNKGNVVRFPAIGDQELGVKIVKKSELENLIKLRELKARTSTQVMNKINAIGHYMIGEAVKKYTDKMFDELIGNCFVNDQIFDKLKKVINDGIDLTMAKMKLSYTIEETLRRHKQEIKIAAGLDFDELGPVINGKVTRENWLKFMNLQLSYCMPGTAPEDLIDPFTGLSDEEQAELDEMAREAWGEIQDLDHDDMEDRNEELREIMNQNSDEIDENDGDIPF